MQGLRVGRKFSEGDLIFLNSRFRRATILVACNFFRRSKDNPRLAIRFSRAGRDRDFRSKIPRRDFTL
jgi:hypothetical protein